MILLLSLALGHVVDVDLDVTALVALGSALRVISVGSSDPDLL